MARSEYKDVLIVDDDEAVRLLLCRPLVRMRLTVDTAVDGEDALEKIAVCRYSVVLSDLMMPRVDGADFVRRLAEVEQKSHERPVVLIVTAHPESELLETLGNDVQAVVRKPVNVKELTEVVRACVHATRANEEPPPRPRGVSGGRSARRTTSGS
jgi:two-component system response regulator MprA